MIPQLLAQVGTVNNPFSALGGPVAYTASTCGSGLFILLNNLVKLIIVLAGVYAFFNFILAGYSFLSAGGDPKAISKAWEKIWQSILGLTIVAGSFILAGIVGLIIFGNYTALLTPRIYTPGANCSGGGSGYIPPPTCSSQGGECRTSQCALGAQIQGVCPTNQFCCDPDIP